MTMMIRTGFSGQDGFPMIWNASASTPRWNADMSARLPSGLPGGTGCVPKRQRGIPHDACYVSCSGGGGRLRALLRYALSLLIGAGFFGIAGPMATLSVNIGGSAMMGLLAGGMAAGLVLPEPWRLFIAVGFLGALNHLFQLCAGCRVVAAAQRPDDEPCLYLPVSRPVAAGVRRGYMLLTGMLFGRGGG